MSVEGLERERGLSVREGETSASRDTDPVRTITGGWTVDDRKSDVNPVEREV